MLGAVKAEEEMKKKVEEYNKLKEDFEKMEKVQKELEEQNVTLLQQKNDLSLQVQSKEDTLSDCEEKVAKLVTQRSLLLEYFAFCFLAFLLFFKFDDFQIKMKIFI